MGIRAELHRQQKKDERQTAIGNQILQRLTTARDGARKKNEIQLAKEVESTKTYC